MIRLVAMTEGEFRRYLATAVVGYAEERLRCGDCTREQAKARAEADYAALLPQGLATPGMFLYTIHSDGAREPIGLAWLAMPGRDGPQSAYLYDFAIAPTHRRRGYGAAALGAVEGLARRMGARQVALNVMGWNAPARALYEKAGFRIAGIGMFKMLE